MGNEEDVICPFAYFLGTQVITWGYTPEINHELLPDKFEKTFYLLQIKIMPPDVCTLTYKLIVFYTGKRTCRNFTAIL